VPFPNGRGVPNVAHSLPIVRGFVSAPSQPQLSQVFTTAFTADQGSFVLTGVDALFALQQLSAFGSYALNGQSLTFAATWPESAGNYALTGQGAVFVGQFVTASGTFGLAGQDAVFDPGEAAISGSFALTGSDAGLQTQIAVSFGPFALAGQDVGDPAIFFLVDPGLFTLTGGDVVDIVGPNVATVGGGAGVIHRAGDELRHSGASFSRKRWLELLAEIEAERKAALNEVKARKPAARKAIRAAAVVAEQAIEVARSTFDHKVVAADLRAMTGALESAAHAKSVAVAHAKAKQAAELAQAILAAHQAEIDDEEEAIALLLAA
jgi:hypothetical protein